MKHPSGLIRPAGVLLRVKAADTKAAVVAVDMVPERAHLKAARHEVAAPVGVLPGAREFVVQMARVPAGVRRTSPSVMHASSNPAATSNDARTRCAQARRQHRAPPRSVAR